MRQNWIGTVILVGVSMAAGSLLSQMWEQVLGQPTGLSAPAQQVVVQQPTELPKCFVDCVTLPPQGGSPPQIRVITVVDTEAKKIVVYHMAMATGQLWLRSVRDMQPDLMLHEYNATLPTPSEIIGELQRFGVKSY